MLGGRECHVSKLSEDSSVLPCSSRNVPGRGHQHPPGVHSKAEAGGVQGGRVSLQFALFSEFLSPYIIHMRPAMRRPSIYQNKVNSPMHVCIQLTLFIFLIRSDPTYPIF